MQTLTVDYEYNADEFWDALREKLPSAGLGPAALDTVGALLKGLSDDEVEDEAAGELLAWFASLPGWAAGPAHARHPVVFSPAGGRR